MRAADLEKFKEKLTKLALEAAGDKGFEVAIPIDAVLGAGIIRRIWSGIWAFWSRLARDSASLCLG